MSQGKNLVWSSVLAMVLLLCGVPQARAVVWYGNGVGGFNPNLPDFYQHQDFISGLNGAGGANGNNGWEPFGGWCEYTAYSDAMYDLTTRGYSGLFTTDPTVNPWQTAMYGPNTTLAGVGASNIARLVGNMGTIGNNWQAYLNLTANQTPAVKTGAKAPLISNTLPTAANGNVLFYNAFGQLVSSGQSVFKFTNNAVKYLNSEVLYRLRSGTANLGRNANGQSVWWGGTGPGAFHYVALAGISVANGNVTIADPDTNFGSGPTAGGWPRGQQALNIGFPFSSPAGSALPVQANAAPITQDFADFNFAGRSVTSAAAPQYNGTFVQSVNLIAPLNLRGAKQVLKPSIVLGSAKPALGVKPAIPGDNDEDLTIGIPADSTEPVDQVEIEPSSMASDPSAEPGEFSLTDDTTAGGTWSDALETTDPFGNAMTDDGIDYDLSGGTPLEAGDTADLDIATASDFTTSGYDVFMHFEGDASDPDGEWVPEEIGGTNFDPEDTASDQDVPEPASLMILGVVCGLAMSRKRQASVDAGKCLIGRCAL